MLCQRLDAGRVLELVQTDDVAVEPGQRGEELVALARELVRLVGVGPAAVEVRVAAARCPGRSRSSVVSSVTKKLSVFIAATRSVPPTGSGAAGRGFAGM